MSKLHEAKVKARLLAEVAVETRSAKVAVRPLRLAFLIHLGTPEDALLRYIAYNTSIWGGVYNCLIPSDGASLEEYWWDVLKTHDPDEVVFCGPTTHELRERVEEAVQPFALLGWTDDAASQHSSGLDSFGSLPVRQVLFYAYKTSGPVRASHISLPSWGVESPYRLCAAAQLGLASEELATIYADLFRAETVDLGQGDLEPHLKGLAEFVDRPSPLDITRWNTRTLSEGGITSPGFNLVLVSERRSVEDLCVFWNLRAIALRRLHLVLPIRVLRGSQNVRTLAEWCNENVKGTNYLNLVSAGVGRRRLLRLRDRLAQLLDNRFEFVDIWHSGFRIAKFRAHEPEEHQSVTLENGAFTLPKPAPSFGEAVRGNAEWVVDVDFRDLTDPYLGYVPPRYSYLSHFLSEGPPGVASEIIPGGRRIRVAHNSFSFRVNKATKHVRGWLPQEEKLFASLLESKRYKSRITDKCRYTKGIINLLGGYTDAYILQDEGMRKLMYAMGQGKAYTPDEMKAFLKPGAAASKHRQVEEHIADLALKRIFLRGYRIRCPACDLTQWYPIHYVAETVQCAGCLSDLQPPIDAPFSYKLNELMIRGIEQGVVPLLLTILVLSFLSHEGFLFVPGVEIQKGSVKADIDLMAASSGELILTECKDLEQGSRPELIKEIVEQFATVVEIASDLGARIVFLSTLLDQAPKDLWGGINRIARRHSDITVHVILKADLERGFLTRSASPLLRPALSDKQIPMGLRDLLPKPRRRTDGWIRKPGERKVSF